MSETKIDLDAIRQAIEERDAALQAADDLANEMVYRGNSVSWWWSKANAYRDAIEKCWNEVQKGGLRADGDTPVWESIRKIVAERDALSAEVERLRASQQWQPIATAPRNGSSVIIGVSGKGSGEGIYATEPGWKGWTKPGWYWVGEDADLARPIEPTHWMPLPEPPAERGEG